MVDILLMMGYFLVCLVGDRGLSYMEFVVLLFVLFFGDLYKKVSRIFVMKIIYGYKMWSFVSLVFFMYLGIVNIFVERFIVVIVFLESYFRVF